jgi:ABC-type nickel/cobalt efflux system permease component RcnA
LLAAALIADLARVSLGLALVVAAVAKLAAGSRWVDQAATLGVWRPIAVTLPWFELVVGAAAVAGLAEPWLEAIAVGLLAVFTAWIAVHLVRGEHPPCACFGAFSAAPLSWWHVARNVGLIALGVVSVI